MMCGIVGYIGDEVTSDLLLQGLSRLEYRGYDSAGLVVLQDANFSLFREVGRVHNLTQSLQGMEFKGTGIAHTRWATHGGVTQQNAHPHMSQDRQIIIVHNGIIENATFLREKLQSNGISLQSETDSEVISQILANFYAGKGPFGEEGKSPETLGKPRLALQRTLQLARGTWGIAALFKDRPDYILCARNGSPLVVGVADDAMYVASDPHALTPYCPDVSYL